MEDIFFFWMVVMEDSYMNRSHTAKLVEALTEKAQKIVLIQTNWMMRQ